MSSSWEFLRNNKKWWVPLVILFVGLGVLGALTASGVLSLGVTVH